jgi:hypothetical protein
MEFLGKEEILNHYKTGFLCSRQCPAEVVLKSYYRAKKQRDEGNCVVCGNHSQIEKDVFEILLKGSQPLILVLARGVKSRWERVIEQAVEQHRLLVISPFEKEIKRVTRDTAKIRNQRIIEMCDELVVGYATKGGQLEALLKEGTPNISLLSK